MVKLYCLFFSLLISCSSMPAPSGGYNAMENTQISSDHWLHQTRFSVFARLPWNRDGGIPHKIQPGIPALFRSDGPNDQNWGALSFYAVGEGELLIGSGSEYALVTNNGEVGFRFQLEGGHLISVVRQSNQVLLGLAKLQSGSTELLEFEPRSVKVSETAENWEQLIRVGEETYAVVKQNDVYGLRPIDPPGDVIQTTSAQTLPLFSHQPGKIEYLSYDPQANRRIWNTETINGTIETTEVPSDLYGCFSNPIAVDRNGTVYGRQGSTLGIMGKEGDKIGKGILEGVVLNDANHLYLSEHLHDSGVVRVYAKKENEVNLVAEVEIPENVSSELNRPAWKLVAVGENEIRFLGRNPRSMEAHQLVYNRRDGTMKTESVSGDLSRLGSFFQIKNLRVLHSGDLILPIFTPDELLLIKLQIVE